MAIRSNKGFSMIGMVGVCGLLMAISGAFLARTTENRLAMRKALQENNFSMTMDGVVREFGIKSTEIAVSGENFAHFAAPENIAERLLSALPAEWRAELEESPASRMVDVGIRVTPFPRGVSMNLLEDPNRYSVLPPQDSSRSSLLFQRSAVGRRWGFTVDSLIVVYDNLAELQGSWVAQGRGIRGTGRAMSGNPDSPMARPELMRNSSRTVFHVTEIPSQFSLQGNKMAIAGAPSANHNHFIGASAPSPTSPGAHRPTVLGRSVALDDSNVEVASGRRVVARGHVVDRTALSADGATGPVPVGDRAFTQEMAALGSVMVIPVGTRGPEIFRPASDYERMIEQNNHQDFKRAALDNTIFLPYWLPYYMSALRVTVQMPGTDPATDPSGGQVFRINGSFSPASQALAAPPVDRMSEIPLEPGSAEPTVSTFSKIVHDITPVERFSRSVFADLDDTTLDVDPTRNYSTPIRVVSRPVIFGSAQTWVNTVDVDVGKMIAMAHAAGLDNLSIFIDIRGNAGTAPINTAASYLPNASDFYVVIKNAEDISMPFSLVTPGKVYIQGLFGVGNPAPFSIFSPELRYGMVSRTPPRVRVAGQRVVVGGDNADTPSNPLNVISGGEVLPQTVTNHFSDLRVNAAAPFSMLDLPPVFLRDWIVESYEAGES